MHSKNISISQSNARFRLEVAFTSPSFVPDEIAFSAKAKNSSGDISYTGIIISDPKLESCPISSAYKMNWNRSFISLISSMSTSLYYFKRLNASFIASTVFNVECFFWKAKPLFPHAPYEGTYPPPVLFRWYSLSDKDMPDLVPMWRNRKIHKLLSLEK